jgi:hypothetical protein
MGTKEKNRASEDAETATQDAPHRPVKTFRLEECSVSVWSREHVVRGENIVFWSATPERSYKDASGTWKYTKSFDADELGKLITLCQQAREFILEQSSK